jgi:tRNA G10  N-methylase Trm11
VTGFLAVCPRIFRNDLVAAECENLTGGKPEADGIAECQSVERIAQAAYVHTGLRLIARAETFESLLGNVAEQSFPADRFRVEHLRLTDHKLLHRREAAIRLANVIPAYPDLETPEHRFLLIERDCGLWFGEILVEADRSYREHDTKPFRTSTSLPAQLARAIVNLAAPPAQSIFNACCGTGSILLEAKALGLAAFGLDWNPRMVGMARKNLAHFGYPGEVALADFRQTGRAAEALIIDLPYGLFMKENPGMIREVIEHAPRVAPLAVFVSGRDLSDWLQEAGYGAVEVFRVWKHPEFSRFVHRARVGVS